MVSEKRKEYMKIYMREKRARDKSQAKNEEKTGVSLKERGGGRSAEPGTHKILTPSQVELRSIQRKANPPPLNSVATPVSRGLATIISQHKPSISQEQYEAMFLIWSKLESAHYLKKEERNEMLKFITDTMFLLKESQDIISRNGNQHTN